MRFERLDNCKICGRLFVKEHTDICLDCYHEIEREFNRVEDFLKIEQNRLATLEIVSEQTNVSKKRIANFIRDGRIYADDFPQLGYPCKSCGTLIKRQVLCNDCYEQLVTEIKKSLHKESSTE